MGRYELQIILFVILSLGLLVTGCPNGGSHSPVGGGGGGGGDNQPLPDECVELTPSWATQMAPSAGSVHFVARDCETGDPVTDLEISELEFLEDGEPVGEGEALRQMPRDVFRHYVTVIVDGSPQAAEQGDVISGAVQDFVQLLMGPDGSGAHMGLEVLLGSEDRALRQLPILGRELVVQQAGSLFEGDHTWEAADLDSAIPASISELQAHLEQVHHRNQAGVVPVGHLIVISITDGELSAQTEEFIDAHAVGGTTLPQKPAINTWPVLIGDADELAGAFEEVVAGIAAHTQGSYVFAYCSESRGGAADLVVSHLGADSPAVTFAIDASDFEDGCSAELFDSSCDDRQCGGLHCGGCSDSTEICGDADLGECIDYCHYAVACEGQLIETDLGHELECDLGPDVTTCDDQCIDLAEDEDHCGQCGNACTAPDSVCVNGTCRCPDGSYDCGGECVNLLTDVDHCGACGNVCPDGISCEDAICPCGGGQRACDGVCVSTSTNIDHCGECGNACEGYDLCDGGTCLCEAGRDFCDDSCLDVLDNDEHCGECDNACDADQFCDGGACACVDDGEKACGDDGQCIDVMANDDHCGDCGNACGDGRSCVEGQCICDGDDELWCAQDCVDVMTSDDHCGDCDASCGDDASCSGGECLCDEGTLDFCDGQCVDTSENIEHCGDCGAPCPTGQVCTEGICAVENVNDDRQVTTGQHHTCMLDFDGTAICWGRDGDNQATTPWSTFVQLSAGERYNCGVRPDALVFCWGRNISDSAVAPAGYFQQVSAGWNHTCGVRENEELHCWGSNQDDKADPPSGEFLQVGVNYNHSCAVATDGSIECWGNDNFDKTDPPAGSFEKLSVGFHHNCALATDGSIECWGNNSNGETDAPTSGTFIDVGAGGNHSCAIEDDQSIHCWGNNDNGQTDAPTSGSFKSISAGMYYTCAVDTSDDVHCWGADDYGQSTVPDGL